MTMIIKPEIDESLTTRRGHNKLMNRNNREVGEYHKSKTIPRHFKINPDTRPGGAYGYEPRSRYHQIRKNRTKKHRKPNVFSGKLEKEVTTNSTVRATPKRWSFKAKSYFPLTLDRQRELEAVSTAEQSKYVGQLERNYAKRANQKQYRTNRKRRA